MFYIVLFIGVITLLSLMAWRLPVQPQALGIEPWPPRKGAGDSAAPGDLVARLLRGAREEKPCLSPVDCVRSGRCAGHCGWR